MQTEADTNQVDWRQQRKEKKKIRKLEKQRKRDELGAPQKEQPQTTADKHRSQHNNEPQTSATVKLESSQAGGLQTNTDKHQLQRNDDQLAQPQTRAADSLPIIVGSLGEPNSSTPTEALACSTHELVPPAKKKQKKRHEENPVTTAIANMKYSILKPKHQAEDPELDRILIDPSNLQRLHSSQVPIFFQDKIVNISCREILATKWLDITHLNELSALFGLKFKKGLFSTVEKATIEKMIERYCQEYRLSRHEFAQMLTQKKKRAERHKLKEVVPTISDELPGRPLISVWKYIRRAYDPQARLGPWTPEDEAALMEAHRKHGQSWTLIADEVGRSADDCKDRWRNYTCGRDVQNQGEWSREEEDHLTQLMIKSKSINPDPKALNSDGLWTWISHQMSGRRSPSQCRAKWITGLQPKVANGGEARPWTKRDILCLAQQLKKFDLGDEVAFDWKQIWKGVEGWEVYNQAILRRKWKIIQKHERKKHYKEWVTEPARDGDSDPPTLSNQQIIDHLIEKLSGLDDAILDSVIRMKKSTNEGSEAKDSRGNGVRKEGSSQKVTKKRKPPLSDAWVETDSSDGE